MTEHVLQTVSETTDVRTVVVRLGQVTGNKLGYWNEKEWFPSLVKTALHQHCLPQLEGVCTFSDISLVLLTTFSARVVVPRVRGG